MESKAAEWIGYISSNGYEEIFHAIYHSGKIGIAITDLHGGIITSNVQFMSSFADDAQEHLTLLLSSNAQGKMSSKGIVEFPLHSSFSKVQLSRLKITARDRKDAYLWWIAPEGKDVTRKQVRILTNLYRSFIDSAFEMIFRTSADGKILFANKFFIRSFAFSSYRECKSTDPARLFESEEEYALLCEQLIQEGAVHQQTIYFRKIDGSRLIGAVNGKMYEDETGQPVFNWTILDISERLVYEQDLKNKNEQLAKVNTQMEKFLYSASHDLRSPLTSILGLTNLLRIESRDPMVTDYADKIEHCTAKLDKIIRDIMNFSKTTYQHSKSARIDMESLCWKLINSHHNDPNLKKIFFEVNVTGEAIFYSDPDRIEIILENLIRNAITFYDTNKVRPFVRINVVIASEGMMLEVLDNGIGIPPHHLQNVFNMFYKASDRSNGSGLGLYIVKESVQQLKAQVQLESEIGFGSVFRLHFPNDHKGKLITRKQKLTQTSLN